MASSDLGGIEVCLHLWNSVLWFDVYPPHLKIFLLLLLLLLLLLTTATTTTTTTTATTTTTTAAAAATTTTKTTTTTYLGNTYTHRSIVFKSLFLLHIK